MKWIIRVWKEFWTPSLKCSRLDCVFELKTRRIRTYQMEDYEQTIKICKRCSLFQEVKREYLAGYTSVSMPSDMWDEIRKNGYVVID